MHVAALIVLYQVAAAPKRRVWEGEIMRVFLGLLIAVYSTASLSYATAPPKSKLAEQKVVDVIKARLTAANSRDVIAWSRYVGDDLIFGDDDGSLVKKADAVRQLKKLSPSYDRSDNPRDFVVIIHDGTAVANYRITTHEQFGDSDIVSEQRDTDTLIKRHASWLLIAHQATNLPINRRRPLTDNASAYADYVGQYEWRPFGTKDTVSVKDGKLRSRIGDEEEDYLPLGYETFFVRDDLASVKFVRDVHGRVTGYTYTRADGQEIHVRKVE